MFFSWVRRSAIKASTKGTDSFLLKQGPGQPRMVVLMSIAALFVAVGAVMYTRVQADTALPTRTGLPAAGKVVKVDGAAFPHDGQFDQTYLTNGRHTVVLSVNQGGDSQFVLDVNNDNGPFEAFRNWAFVWLHANKPAVDRTIAGVTLAGGALLLLLATRYWLRRKVRAKAR
jgi:hypothetical protein